MAFRDWEETEAANLLVLPIKGKHYRIPPLGHLSAIQIRESMAQVATGDRPSMTNEEFLTAVLGEPLLAEMRADNVPERAIIHAAIVAETDADLGRAAAEEMWEAGPSPEAVAAALNMAAAIADSTTSPSTPLQARTSSTKPRASSASTRSRNPRKSAPRSSGGKSSTTRGS